MNSAKDDAVKSIRQLIDNALLAAWVAGTNNHIGGDVLYQSTEHYKLEKKILFSAIATLLPAEAREWQDDILRDILEYMENHVKFYGITGRPKQLLDAYKKSHECDYESKPPSSEGEA